MSVFCHFWPFFALYDFQRFSFLCKKFNNYPFKRINLCDNPDYIELLNIASKYGFNMCDSRFSLKSKIWKYLEIYLFDN